MVLFCFVLVLVLTDDQSLFTETQHTCQGKSKDISGTGEDPTPSLHMYTQAHVSQGPTEGLDQAC